MLRHDAKRGIIMGKLDEMAAEIKSRPGFAEQAGMILLHNGIVRGFSRDGRKKVLAMRVKANEKKIGEICQELGSRPGIFAISAESVEGLLKPGDDALYLAVAGDYRENVIEAFTELLNRIKSEGMEKEEIFEA